MAKELPKEKVPETTTGLAGAYNAICGDTYFNQGPKRSGILTDFFLVSRSTATPSGATVHPILNLGPSGASFIKDKEGKEKIDGVMKRHNCSDTLPDDPEGTRNFMLSNRKTFARKFGAYDETTGEIDWPKIQRMAGVIVSFNLTEKNDFLNIDTKSIQVFEHQRISRENLDLLYKIWTEEIEKRKTAKGKTAAPPSAPPPPPLNADGLPF